MKIKSKLVTDPWRFGVLPLCLGYPQTNAIYILYEVSICSKFKLYRIRSLLGFYSLVNFIPHVHRS